MSIILKRPFLNLCVNIFCRNFKPTTRFIHTNYLKCLPSTRIVSYDIPNLQFIRRKSKSAKQKEESESDESDNETQDFDSLVVDKNTKIVTAKVNTLRVDVVLKNGLGIARNKIEELFYMSKIRVNGKKVLKKSELVQEGDEIDIIKEYNEETKFLTVARVEVLSVTPKKDAYGIRLRRCKSLIVENYEDSWKPNE